MSKNNNSDKPVDVFIEHQLSKEKDKITGQKTVIKSLLKIPFQPDNKPKALSVYGKGSYAILYASTRLETLKETADYYEADVTYKEDLLGKECELTDVESKKVVLHGVITEKKAESQIIELPQTKKAANN